MKIALYGRIFSKETSQYIQLLITKLEHFKSDMIVYEPFYNLIKNKVTFSSKISLFNTHEEIKNNNIDFLFSIGGDGTLLRTITLIKDLGIPVLGINTGRLGFLSSISKEEITSAINSIMHKNFYLDKRSLLKLETNNNLFGNTNYALNELVIHKKDFSTMIVINAYINDKLINSYRADGLIIATPTGSTAYSLSCGGPIITPGSKNFIITPIASHNLTVRPIVISDDNIIKLKINEKNKKILVCLDSRSETIDSSTELVVSKESFKFNLIRMKNKNFFETIRNKLLWGLDIRN
jgi:NAD+ kinase